MLAVLDPAPGSREIAGEALAVIDRLELIGDTPDDACRPVERGQFVLNRASVCVVEGLYLPHKGRSATMGLVMRPMYSDCFVGLFGGYMTPLEEEAEELP